MACSLGTGGGHLPPQIPPKVSFELSDAVKEYAAQVQLKLAGLEPIADSDAALAQIASAKCDTGEFLQSEPLPEETILPSKPDITCVANNNVARRMSMLNEDQQTVSTATDVPSATLTSVKNLFPPSAQFFATQKQRKRKREAETDCETVRKKLCEQKINLIANEENRRSELHIICVEIKKKELAIKAKQAEFWELAVSAFDQNPSFSEIANVSNVMQRFECLNPTEEQQ